MRFFAVYLILCVLTAFLAAMGNPNFQFAPIQTLTSQLSDSKPQELFPYNPKPVESQAVIDARSAHCIENPGFDRWVAVFKPLQNGQRRWIKLKTHIEAEFTDLDLNDDLPPIFASWFELPDGSRCEASPLKLSANEKTELTTQSIRYINPDIATFAFSFVVFKRSHDGIVNFSNISLEVVGINIFYVVAMVLTVGLLLILVAYILYRNKALYSVPIVAGLFLVNVFIISLMLTSSDKIVAVFGTLLKTVGLGTELDVLSYFSIAHAVVFAGSTLLVLFLKNKTGLSVVKIILLLVLMAFTSEAFQLHVTSRSSTMEDIVYDFAGIAIGAFIWLVLSTLVEFVFKNPIETAANENQPTNHNDD